MRGYYTFAFAIYYIKENLSLKLLHLIGIVFLTKDIYENYY